MKNRICAALLIALLTLSLLTGCSVRQMAHTLDRAEDVIEHELEKGEEILEHKLEKSMDTAKPKPEKARDSEKAPATVTEAANRLTREEVQAIALEHAGFTADQARSLRTEFEIDDRIPHYDVDFQSGRWEYEYEIHAETGAILSFEKDD